MCLLCARLVSKSGTKAHIQSAGYTMTKTVRKTRLVGPRRYHVSRPSGWVSGLIDVSA